MTLRLGQSQPSPDSQVSSGWLGQAYQEFGSEAGKQQGDHDGLVSLWVKDIASFLHADGALDESFWISLWGKDFCVCVKMSRFLFQCV